MRRVLGSSVLCPVATLSVLAVLVRLPLFSIPLDPDEGGYAYVAHRWAQGASLYRNPWVDRPQGLVIVFRAVTDVSYTADALRTVAMLAGVALTLSVAAAGWAVGGRRAAIVSGTIAAVVGAGSFIEGYELSGELLGSAIGTCGVALALWWSRAGLGRGWLFVAGVICGLAPLMKQSMLDAAVALICIVIATRRYREVVAAAAGLLIAPLIAVVWGWRTGWHEWWFAVVRFQLTRSTAGGVHAHLDKILHSLQGVSVDLAGLACAAVLALVFAVRCPARWPLVAWLGAAAVCAAGGSAESPHYWVQLVAPLAVLAGSASSAVSRHGYKLLLEVTVLVLALTLPLARLGQLSVAAPSERAGRVVPSTNPQRLAQAAVAHWIDMNTARTDTVYAFVAAADLYLRTGRSTSFPYLWLAPVKYLPGARLRLQQWLSSGDAPDWIVVYQMPEAVQGAVPLAGILAARYRLAATVDGYQILRRVS